MAKSNDSYSDDSMPCLVAKLPCGHYVAACCLDVEDLKESVPRFMREMQNRGAELEVKPISFVRNGGLTLDYSCHGR